MTHRFQFGPLYWILREDRTPVPVEGNNQP
jgi:hypothetical protein